MPQARHPQQRQLAVIRRWLLPLLILLLAAALRLTNLGHDSLWFDEALTRNTAAAALLSPSAALDVRDHVPLLYWLVAASLSLLGEGEIALRLPSAMAGVLAVAVLIGFGRTARLPGAGLWAALLLALSPLAVRHAQEARHYSLLLLFSLLSLYWLYRALDGWRPDLSGLRKPDSSMRHWLYFALATVLNLLTHYSAWLLLAGQAAAAGLWLIWRTRRGQQVVWRPVALAALVVGAALLPLSLRAITAFQANTASAAGTTAAAPLGTWLRAIGLEFGLFSAPVAVGLALLAAAGGLLLARQRPLAALLLATAALPVLLIQLLDITRFALPKYVIYLLPGYLFAAGVAVDAALRLLPQPGARVVSGGLAAGLVLAVGLPAVGREHALMVHDWRGAAARLTGADVVLAVALDTGDGFNAAGVMAPVYLDPATTLLDGNHLTAADLAPLAGQQGKVGGLALNLYGPVTAEGWAALNHQGSLYSLSRWENETADKDVLVQIAALYGQVIPQALPAAACDLSLRLAEVEVARGDIAAVEEALGMTGQEGDVRRPVESASPEAEECPRSADRTRLETIARQARLAEALVAGDRATVDRLAAALLDENPRDTAALAAVTVVDVLSLLAAGELAIDAGDAPEPVEARRFEMPTDGDWGEVLFTHPPAAVTFTVTLPLEPTALQFRIANDPQSWEWGGDGVTFVVEVRPVSSAIRENRVTELFRQHIGHDPAGRGWHAVSLPLDAYAGQSVALTLRTEVGPAGDGTGDWAGWESPRMVRLTE